MSKLAWGAKVSPDFRKRLKEVVAELGWPEEYASWLLSCIAFETGRTFSPTIRNPASGALGLIQFMKATLNHLGYTPLQLQKMTAVQQLEVVKKYFIPYANKIKNLESLYMAILYPAAISKPNEHPLFKIGTIAYRQNKGLDINKNGYITKGEAAAKVRAALAEGLMPGNIWNE